MTDQAIRARADALIARMTPEEKAAQLSQYFYAQSTPSANGAALAALETTGVGSLYLLSDPVEINRLQRIALEKSRLKIPVMFAYDVIHGMRTAFPVPLGMAASWDPALVEQGQAVAAKEARASGVNWTLAPMVDIARDPRWGRMVEGAGEDPYLGSAMAAAQVRGFQGAYVGAPDHVLSGPKHFAGYGAAIGGRDYDEADISDADLWNIYLPPFKAAVDAGAGNIMSAYMPLNGVPGAGNHWLLTTVLRDTWGFKGFVVTDADGVNSLPVHGLATDKADAAVRALQAGADLEMTSTTPAVAALPQALKEGRITQETLDQAVRRVLEAKIRLGLFEHPFVDEKTSEAILNDPVHLAAARVAAERASVLLRNDAGLLPLDRGRVKSLAVIGPLADSAFDALGPWMFQSAKPHSQSILAGLKAKAGSSVRVDYSPGVPMPDRVNPYWFAMDPNPPKPKFDEAAEFQRAVSLAKNADVAVLVLGEEADMSGESASSSSLDLPGRQQRLLDAVVATGKPVVVLLMSGRPLDLKGSKAQAILDIWYPGSQGGSAAANLLFGDAAPGGKLPFTWVRNVGQIPSYYGHMVTHDPAHADKRYWNEDNTPTWPFGFGLAYTSFKYADLRVECPAYAVGEPVKVTVNLTNTGARAGDEVAQLYIHQRSGTSARPIRELKGFQRVTMKPGETRSLSFTLKPEDLRYWSAATRGWVQDPAMFDVWVGGSSTAELATRFEVKGSR